MVKLISGVEYMLKTSEFYLNLFHISTEIFMDSNGINYEAKTI